MIPDDGTIHPRWAAQVRAVLAVVGHTTDVAFVRGWAPGVSFGVVFRPMEPSMVPAFLCALQELKRRLSKAVASSRYDAGHYAEQLDPFGATTSGPHCVPPTPFLCLDFFGIMDESMAGSLRQIRVGFPATSTGEKRPRDDAQEAVVAPPPPVDTMPFLLPEKRTQMLCLVIEDIRGAAESAAAGVLAARGIVARYLAPMVAAMGRIPQRTLLDVLEGQTVPGERGLANLGELFHLRHVAAPQDQIKQLEKYQMSAAALVERVFYFISPAKGGSARLFVMLPPDQPASSQLLGVVKQQLDSTFAVLSRKPDEYEDGLGVEDGVQPAVAYRRARVHVISTMQYFTALQKVQ